jgi:hypothetical protein
MSDEDMIAEDEAAQKADQNQLPVPMDAPKTNGVKRQRKPKQAKTLPRAKRRKAKRTS